MVDPDFFNRSERLSTNTWNDQIELRKLLLKTPVLAVFFFSVVQIRGLENSFANFGGVKVSI